MKQYREMIQAIKERGTHKPAARENMPGTTSLFGYQFRHNLADGFPALTTKKLYWKGVVVELLWFLSGDTNIKFLDDHGVRKMWHEDAYNYYQKIASKNTDSSWNAIYMAINGNDERELAIYANSIKSYSMFTFEEFCKIINTMSLDQLKKDYSCHGYTLGDCGMQYGKLWRNWEGIDRPEVLSIKIDTLNANQLSEFRKQWTKALADNTKPLLIDSVLEPKYLNKGVDQIKDLIEGLKSNPMSRRHILTAWNPATLDDMALNACHAMAQWNCRPIPWEEKLEIAKRHPNVEMENLAITEAAAGNPNYGPIPQYYLDCQMYQRSADVFLGVPLNIASYALLTEILCKICNMVPGEMIYTYGDVHIYDDHKEAINEQLTREERDLPTLKIAHGFVVEWDNIWSDNIDEVVREIKSGGWQNIFQLENYDPHPTIKAKLSTGLK